MSTSLLVLYELSYGLLIGYILLCIQSPVVAGFARRTDEIILMGLGSHNIHIRRRKGGNRPYYRSEYIVFPSIIRNRLRGENHLCYSCDIVVTAAYESN
jgi:hypothetical protein